MSIPKFINNKNENTLKYALKCLLENQGRVCAKSGARELEVAVKIATAFFSLRGYQQIAEDLGHTQATQLLLGTEVLDVLVKKEGEVGISMDEYSKRNLIKGLRENDKAIRAERDHWPFTRSSERFLRDVVQRIRSGNLKVRRYEKAFLHAKAYIFTPLEDESGAEMSGGLVVGSSNLTYAGLSKNIELNLGSYEDKIVEDAVTWFDELWSEAEHYDLAAIIEEMTRTRTPWEVFIRTLWMLYGSEVLEEVKNESSLPLTKFQKHGVARVLRLIRETGGAIVADEVGLGKTFIAGEVLQTYSKNRQRVLLLCPAALRDSTWNSFLSQYQLFVECRSFEELAGDVQLCDLGVGNTARKILDRSIDEYQLVIIDEAHNYRNPATPARAGVLRRLLRGAKRDLLLLTATPVNNSLWDLYHLIGYFVKQDAHFATQGIPSIRQRFLQAMREDPANLCPDTLFPIIDGTTVKRTRKFVKKYYSRDRIMWPDGSFSGIVFPTPNARTIRYSIDESRPGAFDLIEAALSPDSKCVINFSRYTPSKFLKDNEDVESIGRTETVAGLLRTGLLKRFESSSNAFRITIERMIMEHTCFLNGLDLGYVLNTKILKEISASDEDLLEDLVEGSEDHNYASLYNIEALRREVESDRNKLERLLNNITSIPMSDEAKLQALSNEMVDIVGQSKMDSSLPHEEERNRKVIVFTSFADTAEWIYKFLQNEVQRVPELECYIDRIAAISGSVLISDNTRDEVIYGFTPESMNAPKGSREDKYDLLISTDVLAEGVNLQQCRNIINFDLPWNPMRLVQRHGRIDRITSPHKQVFLRTIFPMDRLENLLTLEERVHKKLAMAAKAVGVQAPIEGAVEGSQVFADRREEIGKLVEGDASIFERGGTVNATQSGEEYRQTLRQELDRSGKRIENIPWKIGSGMRKSKGERGMFFHAVVGRRSFLRFVYADENWGVNQSRRCILREVARCLRIIECEEHTETWLPKSIRDRVYDFWETAKEDVFKEWQEYTDPSNLQPSIRPLNIRVAEYIRNHPPVDVDKTRHDLALDIVESPWSLREENMLREWYKSEEYSGAKKSTVLIERILETGIEPAQTPDPLPPIEANEIELLCWMVVDSDTVFDDVSIQLG